MNRVVLNQAEGRYFARSVIRNHLVLLEASRLDNAIRERTTFKQLTELLPQAGEVDKVLGQLKDVPYEFEVYLTKKQKTVLRTLIDDVRKALTEKIIPEYRRRDPVPEERLQQALEKVEMLKILARKLR